MAKSFSDFNGSGTPNSCPRCGVNPREGAVNIRLHDFQEGNSSRYKQIASRQVSMCEECSVEVYELVVGMLNKEANGGTRNARTGGSSTKASKEPSTPQRRRRRRTTTTRA